MKKFFAKIAAILPEILMFISVCCLSFSLIMGISLSAKYEAKAEALAAENTYLKEEIKWFKAQLTDISYDASPTLTNGSASADGGPHE